MSDFVGVSGNLVINLDAIVKAETCPDMKGGMIAYLYFIGDSVYLTLEGEQAENFIKAINRRITKSKKGASQ